MLDSKRIKKQKLKNFDDLNRISDSRLVDWLSKKAHETMKYHKF